MGKTLAKLATSIVPGGGVIAQFGKHWYTPYYVVRCVVYYEYILYEKSLISSYCFVVFVLLFICFCKCDIEILKLLDKSIWQQTFKRFVYGKTPWYTLESVPAKGDWYV